MPRPRRDRQPGSSLKVDKTIHDEHDFIPPVPKVLPMAETIVATELVEVESIENLDGVVVGDYDPDRAKYRPPMPSWRNTVATLFIDRLAEAMPFRTLRRTALELVWVPMGKEYPVEPHVEPGQEPDPTCEFVDYGRRCGLRIVRIRETVPGSGSVCSAPLVSVRLGIDQVRIGSDECAWLGAPNLDCSLPVGASTGPQWLYICDYSELDDAMIDKLVDWAARDDSSIKSTNGEFSAMAWQAVCDTLDRGMVKAIYVK